VSDARDYAAMATPMGLWGTVKLAGGLGRSRIGLRRENGRAGAEVAVRPDEQRVSAPRRGQLVALSACGDAMRDLPLRKMPEKVILRMPASAQCVGVYDMVREDAFQLDKA
jgi:hypothetical protein